MENTVYVTFQEGITTQSTNRVMALCAQIMQQHQPKNLYFLFSSGGGAVDAGVTLYNYLRSLPCTIIMHNIGSIDSIATAVFLAGEERYAAPNSAFLFHGVSWGFAAGANLSYVQMQETMSRFDAAEQLFAGIIAGRTNFEAAELRELFRQGQSKDPSYALSKKVIHGVKDAKQDGPMFSIGQ